MRKIKSKLLLLVLTSLLTACVTQPTITVGDYFQPDGNNAKNGMAKLYIFRKQDALTDVSQANIQANNRPIAVLVTGSYTTVDLDPGHYQFLAKEFGYKTEADLQANKTYYLELYTRTVPTPGVIPTGHGDALVYTNYATLEHTFSLVSQQRAYGDMAFCKQITKVTPAA